MTEGRFEAGEFVSEQESLKESPSHFIRQMLL